MQIFFKEGENFNLILNSAKGFPLIEAFESMFITIHAAGGLVMNPQKELLTIKRFGKWDLPKGKMHRRELAEKAAVREVTEECGITSPGIVRPIGITRHIYSSPFHKKKMVLKYTQWFQMHYEGNETLIPELGEYIEEVRWFRQEQISTLKKDTYASIQELFDYALFLGGL